MHLRRCCVTIPNFVLRVVSYMNVFHEFFVKSKVTQFVMYTNVFKNFCKVKSCLVQMFFMRFFCKVKSCSVIYKFSQRSARHGRPSAGRGAERAKRAERAQSAFTENRLKKYVPHKDLIEKKMCPSLIFLILHTRTT